LPDPVRALSRFVIVASLLTAASAFGEPDANSCDARDDALAQSCPLESSPFERSGNIEGQTVELRARHSGKCMAVRELADREGGVIVQSPCTGVESQKFVLQEVTGGEYKLVGKQSGLCLAPSGSTNGSWLTQQACDDQRWQSFQLVDRDRNEFYLVHEASGKCVDVYAESKADGAIIHLWDCWGSASQHFKPSADLATGPVYGLSVRHSGKCVGVAASSKDNGGHLEQRDCADFDQQKMMFRRTSDGYYRLSPRHSGLCLLPYGEHNNATIIQHSCDYTDSRYQELLKFSIEPRSDGFFNIRHKVSGRCLEISERSSANGAALQLYDCGNGTNQQFAPRSTDRPLEGSLDLALLAKPRARCDSDSHPER
jgi:hypothetical protein